VQTPEIKGKGKVKKEKGKMQGRLSRFVSRKVAKGKDAKFLGTSVIYIFIKSNFISIVFQNKSILEKNL
jgi:hypothetical protein